ncbi:hypothetical protein C4D60_Mb05t10640 [Musa balbisiana]|uniref:Uncharacterized protein n=1 Tax=Musa balbisiana TaxID=52838 RepID=A0A4S8JV58_MUSBA|nr:hypothetical protein C4D60_Mb05t10640 [Musa balbisiana]
MLDVTGENNAMLTGVFIEGKTFQNLSVSSPAPKRMHRSAVPPPDATRLCWCGDQTKDIRRSPILQLKRSAKTNRQDSGDRERGTRGGVIRLEPKEVLAGAYGRSLGARGVGGGVVSEELGS